MSEYDLEKRDEVTYLHLYHGIRSKKSAEEIKKEGFCSYGSTVDEAKSIINALRYFGKEKLLTHNSSKGNRLRSLVREVSSLHRLNTWASTDEEAACRWWAHANPEHVVLALDNAGVSSEDIDKYLKEHFGDKCYNIKLKITSLGSNPNFNTGINCVPPNLIESIEECEECKYTSKEHEMKRKKR